MVQIKGSAIKETIEQIKSRAGEAAFQKILGLLDDQTRKVLEGEIFSSTWYSLDLFTRFLEIEIKVLANGNEDMVTRGSEAVIERQLRGIYKAFVKLGSPEFVIKRIAAVHATYFQGVPIEVKLLGKGRALVKYTGFEKQHRIMGFAIVGFFKKALEISGARDAAIYFSTPIEDGKGYSELSIAWS
ncbi:MAG TPA: hypothetical protein VJW94_04860 [Candidatus Acidoferrum sp.]|nr:hypothetical protein [Candidatus Acidoferrum sp.]